MEVAGLEGRSVEEHGWPLESFTGHPVWCREGSFPCVRSARQSVCNCLCSGLKDHIGFWPGADSSKIGVLKCAVVYPYEIALCRREKECEKEKHSSCERSKVHNRM